MRKRIIALGFFDGVHLGHGALLKHAAKLSDKLSVPSAVLTFNTHPSHILTGEKLMLINTTSERISLIKTLYNIDEVLLCNFDLRFMRLGCEEFVRNVLIDKYNAAHIVAGYDYRFGRNAGGDVSELKRICNKNDIGVSVIEKIELDGITVSSTYIRNLISNGDMESATRYLGHPHCMEGNVLPGKMLGRTLGIPTINLKFEDGIQIPRLGVYISRVVTEHGIFNGVTNIGTRPTVSDKARVNAETHIIDYNKNLYGEHVRIDIIRFLRNEKRFSSLDELKEQISKDIKAAKEFKAVSI